MIMQLRGEGVKRIALVSDFPDKYSEDDYGFDGLTISHRDELITIEKELRDISGTTILIYEQTCAAEKRRRRKKGLLDTPKRRVIINPAICEGCGDCSTQSNCLSVLPLETETGRKRQIDQNACNMDYSCLKGFCPSFVSVVGGQLKSNTTNSDVDHFPELPEPLIASIEDQPWNIVVTGIGGTGVLTIAAIVAMAAHIEGKGCATMNQTGLAQKFGAVVSHVRVGKTQADINAVRIPAGDADLLLGCDLVVTAGDEAMAKVNMERSSAIVNSYETPTADFISNPDVIYPADAMKQTVIEEVGKEKVSFIDATAIASNLLDDSIGSNLFLLGYAYQSGLVPVSAVSIAEAIELNAVSIEFNKKAFLWGRRAFYDLDAVLEYAGNEEPFQALQSLEDISADRIKRLVDYQDTKYAQRYQSLLENVNKAERTLIGENNSLLSIAVARNLYKLMAYKDEYEVARLFSGSAFSEQVKNQFEGDFKLEFHLAPPLISKVDPETSERLKRKLPHFMLKAFALLSMCKGLRGSAFDPFSYQQERKIEQNLIVEYENDISQLLDSLNNKNYESVLELAGLPDSIRGYGHIKLKNIDQFKARRAQLLQRIANGESIKVQTVKIVV
jgi:indolepyruvate ferredoxin oxidoreductase